MIKLDTSVPAPQFLSSARVVKVLTDARKAFKDGDEIKLPALWADDEDTRHKLHERHHDGKCCYCERRRDIKIERDVEHYRPKKAVTEATSHKGYWWLAYDWSNLLISCKTCNTMFKGNKFPIVSEANRVSEEGDVNGEDPLVLNPAIEDPEPYISYLYERSGREWTAFPIACPTHHPERGVATIKVAGLDRTGLMGSNERAEYVQSLMELMGLWNGNRFLIKKAKETKAGLALIDLDQRAIDRLDTAISGYEKEVEEAEEKIRLYLRPDRTYAGFRRYLVAKESRGLIVFDG
ncbi:MAG: hypothetical protein GXP04_15415 [Alphaproteobacteria bacterium]|nr:hypothetical protein [Alphaproteobacteria bacterium]